MKTVYLSAGHAGTKEEGAIVEGVEEKKLNRIIVDKIFKLLNLTDINIITNKDGMDMQERVNEANKYSVDHFIEIHHNAYRDSDVSGLENFYYTASTGGYNLSSNISKCLDRSISFLDIEPIEFRGNKENSSFYVLRNTKMPSVLLELGFLTNVFERELLIKKEYQDILACSIAEGIIKTVKDR